jgi:hypothetical protein
MFVKNLDSGLRVQCHDLSMMSAEASNIFLKLQDIRRKYFRTWSRFKSSLDQYFKNAR